MDEWLSIRSRTVKLLEENIEVNLRELGFDNIFLAITTTKIDKLHLIKKKTFVYQTAWLTKWKTNLQNGRKYFHIMWMVGLTSRICKSSYNTTTTKKDNPIFEWTKDPKRYISGQ